MKTESILKLIFAIAAIFVSYVAAAAAKDEKDLPKLRVGKYSIVEH